MPKLVIVESPTKAKTIAKFLGSGYTVKSSFGHIRDLPKNKTGIDVEHDFEPQYIIPLAKRKVVSELKKAGAKATEILLATDSDREGEAIAWHLAHILGIPDKKIQRLVFHEITVDAIKKSLEHPRHLDANLVNAQQARRVLDRLVGYELSPFLWKKVAKGLSAGRVQSVALRLVIEREREIQAFKVEEYWTVEARFLKDAVNILAKLYKVNNQILPKIAIHTEDEAKKILTELNTADYSIHNLEKKQVRKTPPPPFTTSTLQQEANRRLGYSAKQTMLLAQQLYEGVEIPSEGSTGLITYMRTDSVNLAENFLSDAREVIAKEYGEKFLPSKARKHISKSKNAQEAHEAIRPTNPRLTPARLKTHIDPKQWRLYDLIWKRAIASQMAQSEIEAAVADIFAMEKKYIFRATGNIIKFPGYLAVYPEQQKENILPEMTLKEKMALEKIDPVQHFTEPPARFNDASLIKALEEFGIGRPSTYAPIISTIINRKYVERIENKRLKPSETAFIVNDLLVEHFPQVVDFKFTAKMEDDLDSVAEGKTSWVELIREFYNPFHENLEIKYKELNKKDITDETVSEEKCDKCGSPMIVKFGRFGRFLACSKFPECKSTKPLGGTGAKTEPALLDEKCPECGSQLTRRHGRFGEFTSCSDFPKCKYIKKELKSTGIKCPECKEGDIVERRTHRRNISYSCSRYPDCKYALSNKPTGEKCPTCSSLMVFGPKETVQCSNKECPGKK